MSTVEKQIRVALVKDDQSDFRKFNPALSNCLFCTTVQIQNFVLYKIFTLLPIMLLPLLLVCLLFAINPELADVVELDQIVDSVGDGNEIVESNPYPAHVIISFAAGGVLAATVFLIAFVELGQFDFTLMCYMMKDTDTIYKIANWSLYSGLVVIEYFNGDQAGKIWLLVVILIPIGGTYLFGVLAILLDAAPYYTRTERLYFQFVMLMICAWLTIFELVYDPRPDEAEFIEFRANLTSYGYEFFSTSTVLKESTLLAVTLFTCAGIYNSLVSPNTCITMRPGCFVEKRDLEA